MVSNAFSKLDRIIAIIEDTHPQQWSSEADPGLTLFQREGIKYAYDHEAKQWAAWYDKYPNTRYYGNNGLVAGCVAFISNNFYK